MLSVSKNEQLIIKSILDKPELVYDIKNYFLSFIASDIYKTLKELSDKKMTLSNEHIVMVGNKRNSKITDTLINSIRELDVDLNSFNEYYTLLSKEKGKNNISTDTLKFIAEETSSKDDINMESLYRLQEDLDKNIALMEGNNNEKILLNLGDMIDSYEENLEARISGERTYSFGDAYLDKAVTLKAAPGLISILFADTGSGKSAYALSLINKQINKNIPCIYVSPENDKMMTLDRLLALRLRIPYTYFHDEENMEAMLSEVRKEKIKLKKNKKFLFVEKPDISIKDLENIIIKSKKIMKTEYAIVHVDLLSMLTDFSTDLSPQNIEKQMNRIHEVVRRQNIHLVGVLQMRRDNSDKKPKDYTELDQFAPTLSGIKNAGAWAERSRLVLGMFRPKLYAERYFPEMDQTAIMDDIVKVMILKQNQGKLSMLKYRFDGEIFGFYRWVEEIEETENKDF